MLFSDHIQENRYNFENEKKTGILNYVSSQPYITSRTLQSNIFEYITQVKDETDESSGNQFGLCIF